MFDSYAGWNFLRLIKKRCGLVLKILVEKTPIQPFRQQ